jgi:hypothetical protein
MLASVNVVVSPSHRLVTPDMPSGKGFTVIVAVTMQPAADVKLIVAVPALKPVTTPVVLPTLAAPKTALQLPLPLSDKVVVAPGHTFIGPVIGDGGRFTVTTALTVQPVPSEYITGAVPALSQSTIPLALPIVMLLLVVVHVPPPAVLLKFVVLPMHTCSVPPITDGVVFTVTL